MGGVFAQVGIGTTSPSNDLDVESSSATATAVDINCTSTGDPKINFQLSGTSTFSMGIDNSDADKFKIGTSALETNTRLTINSSGYVGIGTSSPLGPLHVVGTNCTGNAYDRGVASFYYNSSSCSGGFSGYHARGTEASPTTVLNGDFLSGIYMGGHDGTNYISTSYILAKVNGTVATGSIPTDILFETGSTATVAGEKMRLTSAGRLGIGNTAPTALLDVDGSAIFNESGAIKNFRVESDGNANMLFVDGTNDRVGIGTSSPLAPFQVNSSSCGANIYSRGMTNFYFNTSACSGGFMTYKARGTEASPTTVVNGDGMGGWWLGGHDGTNFITTAAILSFANGTVSTGSIPTDISFQTGSTDNGMTEKMRLTSAGRLGIGMTAGTNLLEVNGAASKTAAGDWLANSDARLKKDIKQMDSKAVLDKMLALKGITYYWNDTVTGSKRPTQLQYGFTAQNIKEVFPILVEEDNLGYLQTAYGTYDAMYVESMRALQQQIDAQQAIIEAQKKSNDAQKAEIDALKLNALKVAELENKMNAMLLLLNNKTELTVKQ